MKTFLTLCFIALTVPLKLSKKIPKITVYIESLCPDCKNFILDSFRPFHETIRKPNLVDLEFVPFGNAKEAFNNSTQKWDFTCQHKENECYGNLMQTCALNTVDKKKAYDFIICVDEHIYKMDKDFDKTLDLCLANDEEAKNIIKKCVASDYGNKYQHEMALKTKAHKYVPWILVNGVHDVDAENEIIASLTNYICSKSSCY